MDVVGARTIALGYSRHAKPFYSQGIQKQPHLLLRLQVTGTCSAVLCGTKHSIEPGDLIVSKPGDSYRLEIDAGPDENGEKRIDSADFYLVCDGPWIDAWLARTDFPSKSRIEASEEILSLWRRLVYEKRNLRDDNEELTEALLKALCLTLERAVRNRRIGASGDAAYVPYQIKRYLERHATEPLTLASIAKRHGVSVSTASHLFKRTFGQSIMKYALEVRLAAASERILLSDLPLEAIAEASGFRSYPYFCRAFRARFHVPPSAYRALSLARTGSDRL
ncbi:helix-turn-helix domain-containing protein [Paenibacillus antri]|nr:AraC family transcriptional regulator [Paenibacillus antri]